MGVLSSLLPGLRDLRAPLAAGYIWIFDLWLLFGDDFPTEADATGVFASLYRLGELIPQLGIGIAISFVAYIVGVLFASLSNRLLFAWRRIGPYIETSRKASRRRPRSPSKLSYRVKEFFLLLFFSLGDYEYRMHLRRSLREIVEQSGLPPPELSRYLRRSGVIDQSFVEREIEDPKLYKNPEVWGPLFERNLDNDREVLRARLMAEQEMLYGEFDRYKSEAEFRSSISIPLSTLIGTMAFLAHPAWSLLMVVVAWLWLQAARLEDRADLALVSGVTAGKIESPTLQAIESAVSQAQREKTSTPQPSDATA
jgi:hypothetical protein